MDRNYYADKDCDWVRVVALRKESVDRNSALTFRADLRLVALRKESVDRNKRDFDAIVDMTSRSPQGERG